MKTLKLLALAAVSFSALAAWGCSADGGKAVTLETLLDEMADHRSAALWPEPFYRTLQTSSYDRRSVAPGLPGWFANDDGSGYVRLDTIAGRVEKVLFEDEGPGVVTRIWMTTLVKNGTLRFYFDGGEQPLFEIPAYDMSQATFTVGDALSLLHTNYEPNGKGGNTFMLPMPYARGCRITFEEPDNSLKIPRYYQVNYRKYDPGTRVETFSPESLAALSDKLAQVNERLLSPPTFREGRPVVLDEELAAGGTAVVNLGEGNSAIRTIEFRLTGRPTDYAAAMRTLVIEMEFDGKQTVWAPVGDFSGAGMGAPEVYSWYMDADGARSFTCRWPMPYRDNAVVRFHNLGAEPLAVEARVYTSDWQWEPNSLYFHTAWRQERGIPVTNLYDDDSANLDWNFITLHGRGVNRGDVLSLYNHAPDWYGEGDEKIWVDGEEFPSHFGTGTEDYYNCSWAPVVPFHTPFGGAPRADRADSHGYNTFMRTRNLDAIPFRSSLVFDIEMQSWNPGTVDYSTTTYWYGDVDSRAEGTSGPAEALIPLN